MNFLFISVALKFLMPQIPASSELLYPFLFFWINFFLYTFFFSIFFSLPLFLFLGLYKFSTFPQIPASSELLYPCDRVSGYKSKFPVVRVRNVVVLPGVPQLTEKAFALIDLVIVKSSVYYNTYFQ